MAKPRVIIADTDIIYIIPLQQKLIEEYFGKIDLEIISERNYYEQFLSSPQKADILIISESFYTPEIQKHNIGNIFLMTEEYAEKQINAQNVTSIYKYTSIREVLNVITGKSSASLHILNSVIKKTQIILFYSASGGTGKTTIALGISECLNKSYKRVLYINAAYLQSFQALLSNTSPIVATDVYTKLAMSNRDAYSAIKSEIRSEGFCYVPPFKAALMSLGIEYAVFERIATSAQKSGDYDYIVIDTDVAFDNDKVRLIDIADKVIIVTKQNRLSAYATKTLVSNINGVGSDKYIIICNDFNEDSGNALIASDMANRFAISDYIEHLPYCDQMSVSDLANENSIQKVTFLVS